MRRQVLSAAGWKGGAVFVCFAAALGVVFCSAGEQEQKSSVSDCVVWVLQPAGGKVPESVHCFGRNARMTVDKKTDEPGLIFQYEAVRSEIAGFELRRLSLPAETATLSLRLMPEEDTSVALNLVEESGAMYQAFLWLPAGQWTDADIPLSEFWLAENCTDPDGELKPDDVTTFRLLDLANLPGQVGRALGLKDGPQTLHIARLEFSRKAAGGRSRIEGARAIVDDFTAPPFFLLPIGQPKLKFEQVNGRQGLSIEYVLGRYRWAGIVRGVGHLPVGRAKAIVFDACVMPSARIQVVAEERDGSKYAANVVLRGGAGWRTVRAALKDMALVNGSSDENGRLDPDQVRVVIIVVDTFSTPLRLGAHGHLWLSNLALELQ